MKIAAIGYFIVLILILISFAVINLVRRSKRKKEQDIQYMREAGVAEDEISYTEIIYDTGDGYGGKLITYNSRNNQFYYHPYMWHIDDSQEFEEKVPCSPEQAASIIANCSRDSKNKISAIRRAAEFGKLDVTELINQLTTKYYYFEDSNNIVKVEDDLWYKRDRENHQWIQSNHWMGHFYDPAYSVEEIYYNEETEQIISR